MKKIVTVALAAFSCCFSVVHAQDEKQCFTTEVYRQRIAGHPELLQKRNALEQHTGRYIARQSPGNHTSGQLYIIPIVFHIVHNYGTENISDAQVEDQVRILNEDFRKRSYDTADIVSAFQSIAADCEIEFRLATIDPNGNCTNGIEHIASPRTYNADDRSKLNPWPANQYLNVWVVATLGWSGAAAYAYYPGTAPSGADGIISLSSYIGSIGQGSLSRSRVLTHEVGHYLNLAHPWGDSNDPLISCGDDSVSDTPTTIGWTSCNINGSTCGSTLDNVQNYMEYSYCCNMFTEGQKSRMIASLNSSIGGRDNLWTLSNLIATGTDGTPTQVCVPVTDFKSDFQMGCAGTEFRFRDMTWKGRPTLWNWSFPGGDTTASADSIPPLIRYNTPGVYPVSLVTANASGADSITKSSYIIIPGPVTQLTPLSESFESAGSFPGTEGYVINPYGGNSWMRDTTVGCTGTSSVMMNNFSGSMTGETDDYITPAYDFTNINSPTLKFKLAYARRDTIHNEQLQVYVSIDCGKSWLLRYSKPGFNLSTTGIDTAYFVPTVSQWRQETVSINQYHNLPNVRFRFRLTSGSGNNLYIDDININVVPTDISFRTPEADEFLQVFPNPSSGNFFVSFALDKKTKLNITVSDAAGRRLQTLVDESLHPGTHQFSTGKNLEAGIYFVTMSRDGEQATKKIVIRGE